MPLNQRRLVIMGFGGHARSVADIALACGYGDLIFVEPSAFLGENFMGHRVVRSLDELGSSWSEAFAASGDGKLRGEQCEAIASAGLSLVSLVSPLASIGAGSKISDGCFVGHHAHIGPMACIGVGCIINTGTIVEHEAVVGDFSHVSVNAVIAGRSRIGKLVMIGAGATVLDGVNVVDGVTIGGGGLVHRSIDVPGVYGGVPVHALTVAQIR